MNDDIFRRETIRLPEAEPDDTVHDLSELVKPLDVWVDASLLPPGKWLGEEVPVPIIVEEKS